MFTPKGIIPPLCTPMHADGSINYQALAKLTDYVIENGVHGVFPLGTCGEFYAVPRSEYRKVLGTVKDAANGRVPVCAGAHDITTRGVTEQVKICEEVGVDAVSVLTPWYVACTQDELYGFYCEIAASTTLPVVMYNIAARTNITIKPETAVRLSKLPNIIAVKDSTGDMANSAEYIRLTRGTGFHVLMGQDALIYAGLCHGAAGAIASSANIAPRLVSDIYERFMAGDREGALEAQFSLAPLWKTFNTSSFPAAVKEALRVIGIDAGPCAAPVSPLSGQQQEAVREALKSIGLL